LYLATSSDDYTVAIWDVVNGERVFHILKSNGGYVRVVNWSPDSKRIIAGSLDNVIRVFDVETGALVCEPLTGHKNNLTALSSRPSLQGGETEVVSGALHFLNIIHRGTDPPSQLVLTERSESGD
jgi:WD40 repeat protein